jgi:hypothetical protein
MMLLLKLSEDLADWEKSYHNQGLRMVVGLFIGEGKG